MSLLVLLFRSVCSIAQLLCFLDKAGAGKRIKEKINHLWVGHVFVVTFSYILKHWIVDVEEEKKLPATLLLHLLAKLGGEVQDNTVILFLGHCIITIMKAH